MSARSVGMGAMFGWISATFGLVKRNFGAMSVASVLNLFIIVLMMLPMFFLMFKVMSAGAGAMADPTHPFGMSMGMLGGMYAFLLVFVLLLTPPIMAGWFRLCESADQGAAVSGTDVLRPYSEFPLWLRLIGVVALGTVLYVVVFVLLALVFGGTFTQLMAMQTAQNAAMLSGQPAPPPSMAVLGGVLLMYAVMLPTMFLLQFVYMVSLAEVSLRATPVLVAFKDAFVAVLRNSLKLLLFMFVLMIIGGMIAFAIGLVVALVLVAASFVSKALAMVLVVLLYIPILLVMYPLMFAGNYFAWKSMLGGESSLPVSSAGTVAA